MENKQELEKIGAIFKGQCKQRFNKTLLSMIIAITIEIIFLILLLTNLIPLQKDDSFMKTVFCVIIGIILLVQIVTLIYLYFKYVYPLNKMSDLEAGNYKEELERRNSKIN